MTGEGVAAMTVNDHWCVECGGKRNRPCPSGQCDRYVRHAGEYCCGPCRTAWEATPRYEPHAHSSGCDERQPARCRNCGYPIAPAAHSSTGWTHSNDLLWVGVRCPGLLCGAEGPHLWNVWLGVSVEDQKWAFEPYQEPADSDPPA